MKVTVKRHATFQYPVELVWRGIGVNNNGTVVDPLSEEQYENYEPERNTVFTRAVEVKQNEVFAIQMKTWMSYCDWRIELTPVGPCETKVSFVNKIKYRSASGYILSIFGLLARSEMKRFVDQLGKKIDMDFQKNRPSKED